MRLLNKRREFLDLHAIQGSLNNFLNYPGLENLIVISSILFCAIPLLIGEYYFIFTNFFQFYFKIYSFLPFLITKIYSGYHHHYLDGTSVRCCYPRVSWVIVFLVAFDLYNLYFSLGFSPPLFLPVINIYFCSPLTIKKLSAQLNTKTYMCAS